MFYSNLEIFYEYKDHFCFEYFEIKKSKKNYNFEKYRKFGKF